MNSKRGKAGQTSKCESPAPLIPHIKVQDNQKLLPKYTSALNRSPEEILPAEDLDAIQLELEHLLSTVALRYRVLKSEIDIIEKADDNRDKKGRFTSNNKDNSPNKKKKFDDRNRVREGSGKLFSSHKNQTTKVKNSGVSSSPAPSSSHEDSMDAVPHLNQGGSSQRSSQESSNKLLLPRNDIPNKFWLSVEPYCMPITQEDINLLDDLYEEYTGTVLPPIPDLGPHYSQRWAMDDLKAEFDIGASGSPPKSGSVTSKRNLENGHAGPTNSSTATKKNEKTLGDGVLGPLTQRLVSALMEENLVNAGNNDHSSSGADAMMNHVQPLIKNGIAIEKRLKKELVEQGILDAEDLKEEDDEILTEIKRVRAELAAIGEYNANELRKLHSAAVEEMKRLEVKRQLDAKDQEVSRCIIFSLFQFS